MALILYTLGMYFGYFGPMLLFLVVAVILAKTRAAGIIFAIGAGIQLLSLIGTQKQLSMFGQGSAALMYWVIYILLIFIGIVLISKRKNTVSYRQESSDTSDGVSSVAPQPIPQAGWRCTCGRSHQAYVSSCVCGVSKREAQKKFKRVSFT